MKRLFPPTLLVIALVLLLLVSGRAADKRSSDRQNAVHQTNMQSRENRRFDAANAPKHLYLNFTGPVRDHRNSDAGLYCKPDCNPKSK